MLQCALVQAPGQVQQGSREGSGRRWFPRRSGKLWRRARSGSTGSREGLGGVSAEGGFAAEPDHVEKIPKKVWEALVQSQVRFREVLVQSQVRFKRVPEKVPDFVWEALVQGSSFGAEPGQVQQEKVWEALVQPGQVQQNREAWTSAHLSYVVAVQMQCWR